DARVGQPRDFELLDFAVACFKDVETRAGFHLTTGQDLGHGLMSDGRTQSLVYLNRQFKGSVIADTSRPTGEGNYHVLAGMLRGFDIPLEQATVGLIGCGNIGMHVIGRLRERGTTMLAVESTPQRRAEVAALGIRVFAPEQRDEFLRQPIDALVVNAAGGSLDPTAIALIADNARLKVICGSENLVMADHVAGSEALRAAKKAYCPTELGGMMGYLTAVEQYLASAERVPFDVATLLEAAKVLDGAAFEATRYARESDFAFSFEDAMRAVKTTSP
ncbi:MAG: NAD(P)-dependent oxidoreductase, partial [Gemmatimonadaceae bacterium]